MKICPTLLKHTRKAASSCHAERVSATFQCVSTAKVHLLTNTRMVARVFARIPVFFMTAFTVLVHRKAFSASRFPA